MADLEKFKVMLEQMEHVYLTALQSDHLFINELGNLINKWYDLLDNIYSDYSNVLDEYGNNVNCEEQLNIIESDLEKIISISRGFNV
jgi:hypothetical protein